MWSALAGVGKAALGVAKTVGGAILGNLGGIGAGVAGYVGQQQQNAANAAQAREQMAFQERMVGRQEQFQERMSSTAVQRHVQDLKAAGLNPALAFSSGGASSPGGASAGGAMATMGDALGRGVNSALEARAARAQVNLLRQQEEAARSEVQVQNQRWRIEQDSYGSLVQQAAANVNSALQSARESAARQRLLDEQAENTRVERELLRYQIPQAKAMSKPWETVVGKTILPWVGSAANVAAIAARFRPR